MRLLTTMLFAALAATLIIAPTSTHAQNHGFSGFCEEPDDGFKASMVLAPEDKNSMALAHSFENHLRTQGKDPSIVKALFNASITTGVDFELLLLKAIMESDLGRATIAAKSSARGVFQYIEPTWLTLMHRHGAALGYPHYQEAIKISKKNGIPYLRAQDAFMKTEILALRHDPEIAATMKAYQIKEETDIIREYKGGKVTPTDHYIAHMLGLSLAKEFYDLKKRDSIFAVAKLNMPAMREAAMLNKAFFYDNKKNPLNASDVYKRFETRIKQELKAIDAVASTPYDETPCTDLQAVAFR